MTRMPVGWKMFPGYLRDAGYYCVNNGKEDYNLEKPDGTWDVSWELGASTSGRAAGPATAAALQSRIGSRSCRLHDPAARSGQWPLALEESGQPFLAVFNDMGTHESQIFRSARNPQLSHDPAKAWLAEFQPDTLEMRRDSGPSTMDLLTAVERAVATRLASMSWSRTA